MREKLVFSVKTTSKISLLVEMAITGPVNTSCISVHLAAKLVLHGKVNKADASGDQGVDEPHRVQSGLELGRHHAHEDLPAERLDTVLALHALANALCRGNKAKKKVWMISFIYLTTEPSGPSEALSSLPSELQLFLQVLCLMGVVEGSSTPEKRHGLGASSTHFPSNWLDMDTCMGL